MSKLFYLIALGGFVTSAAHAAVKAPHPQVTHTRSTSVEASDATEALNTLNLVRAQRLQPAPAVALPSTLPDGTIAKGTGTIAPELLEAPIYNPADRH